MRRPRVLLIAEAANPSWVSVPLEGWSLSRTLSDRVDAHLVTQVRNREAIEATGWTHGREFSCIDSEPVARPLWRVDELLRQRLGLGWTASTALSALPYYFFESLLWRRFGRAIEAHEFDIVHRITPLTPTSPSIIARRCARAGVPFVWGPINGGAPWPRYFEATRHAEGEWLSYVRSVYQLLPGYRSTLRHASAIITGSLHAWSQIPRRHRDRCVYVPENGIDPARFHRQVRGPVHRPIRVAFVGRLVPYKGLDMLLEAAAPLLRAGQLVLDVIGDGEMMAPSRRYVRREEIGDAVHFHGWLEHHKLQNVLVEADVLGFPSVREFGGAVVLEAMALGLVPIVADYAGPAEHVTSDTGYRIPLGPRSDFVSRLRNTLEHLAQPTCKLREVGERARRRVQRFYTWEAKAAQVAEIYAWVLGQGEKPDFGFLRTTPSGTS